MYKLSDYQVIIEISAELGIYSQGRVHYRPQVGYHDIYIQGNNFQYIINDKWKQEESSIFWLHFNFSYLLTLSISNASCQKNSSHVT